MKFVLFFCCLLSFNLSAQEACPPKLSAVASNGRSQLKGEVVQISLHERAQHPKYRKFFEFTGEVIRIEESPVYTPTPDSDSDAYVFPARYQADLYIVRIKFNGADQILAVPRRAIKAIAPVNKGIIPITGDIRYDYLDFSDYLSVFDPNSP